MQNLFVGGTYLNTWRDKQIFPFISSVQYVAPGLRSKIIILNISPESGPHELK